MIVFNSKHYQSKLFNYLDAFDFYRILIGMGLIRIPSKKLSKTLVIGLVFGLLILRTIYQSFLTTFLMSNKKHPPLETIGEILAAEFSFYVVAFV